jgi:hypothetical protein
VAGDDDVAMLLHQSPPNNQGALGERHRVLVLLSMYARQNKNLAILEDLRTSYSTRSETGQKVKRKSEKVENQKK